MEVYGWLKETNGFADEKSIDVISYFYVNERNFLLRRFLSKENFSMK